MSNIRVEITDAHEFHCFRLVFRPREPLPGTPRGDTPVPDTAPPAWGIPMPPGGEIEIMLHARALVDLIHVCSSALCDWQALTTCDLILRMTGLSEAEAREKGLIA